MSLPEIVLPLHIFFLAISVVGIFFADSYGLAWFKGKIPILDMVKIKKYHDFVFAGLGALILTGFILFWPMREFLLNNTLFYIKMFFILALVVNGFFIGKLMVVATTRTYESLTNEEKFPLFVSGAVSTIGWISATVIAIVLFG